jgi:hypothetical protein
MTGHPEPVPISLAQERAWRELWAWLLSPVDMDVDEGEQPPEATLPPTPIGNRVTCRDLKETG